MASTPSYVDAGRLRARHVRPRGAEFRLFVGQPYMVAAYSDHLRGAINVTSAAGADGIPRAASRTDGRPSRTRVHDVRRRCSVSGGFAPLVGFTVERRSWGRPYVRCMRVM